MHLSSLISIVATFSLVAFSSGLNRVAAATAGNSPEVKRLVAAAEKNGETGLDLVWSENSIGGSTGIRRYETLFNRMFGTHVKFTFTPGPSMPAMAAKITQELAAGRKASTDVDIGTEAVFVELLKHNTLEPYDYSLLGPRAKKVLAYKNIGLEIYTSIPAIIYNTKLISKAEVPRTLEAVLSSKWKGKVSSTPYAAYFNIVTMRPDWGVKKMKAYITRLSNQVGGLMRLGEDSRLVSGEFSMLVLGNTHTIRTAERKGQPLGYVIPEDAASVGFVHLGVPRNAAHPNLAKLFVYMLVTEEGQKTLFDVYGSDHHELPGSRSAAELKDLKAAGVSVFRGDVKSIMENPEIIKVNRTLSKILSKKK